MRSSDHRQAVLTAEGYHVESDVQQKYKGSGTATICTARKDGHDYYAFHPKPRELALLRRIRELQNNIPHMARVADIVEDVVLFDKAPGSLLWEMEPAPDSSMIESKLRAFAEATMSHGLIHGDLRPWNIFVDGGQVTVIDWGELSTFKDDLHNRRDLTDVGATGVAGHYRKFHPNKSTSDFADLDLIDALRIGRLLRGEIGYREAWNHDGAPAWFPAWCKP